MKTKTILYHILFWAGIYLFWLLVFHSYSVQITKTMTVEFCYLLFITLDYYAIIGFVIPRYLVSGKYLFFILAIFLIICVSAWLRALVAVQMNTYFFHSVQVPDFTLLYFNSVLNISFWVLIITIGRMILERIKNQKELNLLQNEKTKNELDFLKAQINPHALFNSLNTIYGHIDKNNQTARTILLQFSELLRYQLYDCSSEKVALEKEIEYIKNYIAFQQLRKDETITVEIDIENINKELQIAPLLLIVLIENTFKFVSNSHTHKNSIKIKLFTSNNFLHGIFINSIDLPSPDQTTTSNGIGLINLKRRLDLLYTGKYKLKNKIGSAYYESFLTINLA